MVFPSTLRNITQNFLHSTNESCNTETIDIPSLPCSQLSNVYYVSNETKDLYCGPQCPTSSHPNNLSDSICYEAPPLLYFNYSGLRENTPCGLGTSFLSSSKLFIQIFTGLPSSLQKAISSDIPLGKALSVSYTKIAHFLPRLILLIAPTTAWNYVSVFTFCLSY